MRNNYGFIEIDLGVQTFEDADITETLSEETKKKLFDLAKSITGYAIPSVEFATKNNNSKIVTIRLVDANEPYSLFGVATIFSVDALQYISLSITASNYLYEINVDYTDMKISLLRNTLQIVE